VPVRRGALPGRAANRLKAAVIGLFLLGIIGALASTIYRYGVRSSHFRLESSDHIEIIGSRHLSIGQIMQVMGGDIGRNVFFIPLEERRKQLEDIAWVESASVSRLLPDRIRVEVHERTPVAFAKVGSKINLVDSNGVIMDMPPGVRSGDQASERYSFPVIVGMGEAEPPSTRAARMKIYTALVQDLDSGGARYSQDLSEVDLSDPEDVKINTSDPAGEVLIHLGISNFLDRYKVYIANVKQWRRQYPNLNSVDLRYDRQVILNADEPRAKSSALRSPAEAAASRSRPAPGTSTTKRSSKRRK
jgi:cell division protein FtsQ